MSVGQRAETTVDFLGIGAQKAATSWLWENLRQHPQIWLPPEKEIHYFDRSTAYPSPNDLATTYPLQRLVGSAPQDRLFRRKLLRGVRRVLGTARSQQGRGAGQSDGESIVARSRRRRVRVDLQTVRWFARYYFGVYNDDWYRSLFRQGRGRVCGEITPSYSLLEADDVARVHQLFPDLKILLILRNPIERAWSNVRFNWTEGRLDGIDDMQAVKRFIDTPGQSLRSDYLRILDTWGAYYPPERFFIGYYDDIQSQPVEVLRSIFAFLGAERDLHLDPALLQQRVNVSEQAPIPPEIARYLAEKYLPELRHLAERLGGPTHAWVAAAERLAHESANSP